MTTMRESALAHQLLDGKRGIEIGAASHNAFRLKSRCLNLNESFPDYTMQVHGHRRARVDIVCNANHPLPFRDCEWDFVVTSHVIEHLYDVLAALKEFDRVVKPGGYVYSIIPHKDRCGEEDKPRTTLEELVARHLDESDLKARMTRINEHHNFWITRDFVEICQYLGFKTTHVQEFDDKVGNGFCVVWRK